MHNYKGKNLSVGYGPANSFFGLGIVPKILEILENMQFVIPTAIQYKAIPLAIEGKDVIGIAQTGTGKTHAFAIPMVQHLAAQTGTGLVLAPTRELAIQIDEAFREFAHPFGMLTVCLIGGAPMEPQTQTLRKNPRIVIATPGRLLDHMKQWNVVFDDLKMLVFDEADRMLDMGFQPQIEKLLKFLPKKRQTMLFSATMPKEIMGMAVQHMKLPVCVEIAPAGTAAETVTHELFIVKKETKPKLLSKLLAAYHGPILVFSRTKHGARKITKLVRDFGYKAAEMHANRSLSQRREALEGFKSGQYRVLVATDIAARGIDVCGIELVINYDLPDDAQNYVHRIGRTGRAGQKGHAISFATPEQYQDVKSIEELINFSLPVSSHPEIPASRLMSQQPQSRPNRLEQKGFLKHSDGNSHASHKTHHPHNNRQKTFTSKPHL